MVFVNRQAFQSYLIEKTKFYIITRIINGNIKLIVVSVYISPAYDMKNILIELRESVFCLVNKFPDDALIIGGDFNGRVGNNNRFPDDNLFYNTNLNNDRKNLDLECNLRGKLLLECMEDLGLFLINGRSKSDFPAQYTFVSGVGCSVIDLVWVNLEATKILKDLRVLNDLISRSDHFPVKLTLKEEIIYESCEGILKWKENLKDRYFEEMIFSPQVTMHDVNVDICNKKLDKTIIESAKSKLY